MIEKQRSMYVDSTLAFCTECNTNELARINAYSDGVFMERLCSKNGAQKVKIASDYHWYLERNRKPYPSNFNSSSNEFEKGCPFDCGLCNHHINDLHLPVFSITNHCNLNCNICFTYNRNDKKYYISQEDMKKTINTILAEKDEIELINITGGEPTLHPNLFDILTVCQDSRINRITMNTNGIRIANDSEFAKQLKDTGVQLVLSLDTFDPIKSVKIHGKDISTEKKQTLNILESLNIPTTILCVCIKDVNETDVADIVDEYIKKDFVRSITIQNMTFTGANGKKFKPHDYITIDEVENLLATKESFSTDDYFPLYSYHPLCYSVAYYFVHSGYILPFTRLIDKNILTDCTKNSYMLNPDQKLFDAMRDGIDKLWSEGADEDLLRLLKSLIAELYPVGKNISNHEQKQISEKYIKMIYIHSHMDADNFDINRVCQCGDIVPDASGKLIPACSYNLVYRQHDSRFWYEQE